MSDALEVIGDGDGWLVLGDPHEVDRFLAGAKVPSRKLSATHRAAEGLGTAANMVQAGADIASNSGRWVKLTQESAQALKLGSSMKGSADGLRRAIVTKDGKISKILEFAAPGQLGSMLTNPAMLTGVAGLLAQAAAQQSMEEITEYLVSIDRKVDDILRAQKDAALAEMIGVGDTLAEAVTVREHTGRVSEVTWSKIQGSAQTIAATQAYALRQLDALAEKLENETDVAEMAKMLKGIREQSQEWLAVLARCVQLQEGLAVLEVDRVLDSTPAELDSHREGLRVAREQRRARIASTTSRLVRRIDAAASAANRKVLLHPLKAKDVVLSGNIVVADVMAFHNTLGIEMERQSLEAKSWSAAAAEVKDKVVVAGESGTAAVKRLSSRALEGARSASERLADEVKERRNPKGLDDADSGGFSAS